MRIVLIILTLASCGGSSTDRPHPAPLPAPMFSQIASTLWNTNGAGAPAGSRVFVLDGSSGSVGYAVAKNDGTYSAGSMVGTIDDVLELFYETAAGDFSLPACTKLTYGPAQIVDCANALGCSAASADPIPTPTFERM